MWLYVHWTVCGFNTYWERLGPLINGMRTKLGFNHPITSYWDMWRLCQALAFVVSADALETEPGIARTIGSPVTHIGPRVSPFTVAINVPQSQEVDPPTGSGPCPGPSPGPTTPMGSGRWCWSPSPPSPSFRWGLTR